MEKTTTTSKITARCRNRIIWCTQYKRALLTGDIKKTTETALLDAARDNDVQIRSLTIYPFYVEAVVEYDPRKSIHSIVKTLKHCSAARINQTHPEVKHVASSVWTRNYMTCTEGETTKREEIEKYLKSQKTRRETSRE